MHGAGVACGEGEDADLGHVIMGDVHRVFGHEDAARNEYRQGAKEAKREKLDDLRAYALAQAGDLKEATAAADAVLEKNSRDVHALLALAVVAIKTDDLTGAEDQFERMAEIAPAATIGLIEDPQVTASLLRGGLRGLGQFLDEDRSTRIANIRDEVSPLFDEAWQRLQTVTDAQDRRRAFVRALREIHPEVGAEVDALVQTLEAGQRDPMLEARGGESVQESTVRGRRAERLRRRR